MNVASLKLLGVLVKADGAELLLDAPAGVLTAELVAQIREFKAALIDELQQPANDSAPRDRHAMPTYGTSRDTLGRALPVTVRCGDCANFAPNPHSPDAGIGTCAHGEPDQGGVPYFPIGQRRCVMFTPVMTTERATHLEKLR